jgi:hypothetical protein
MVGVAKSRCPQRVREKKKRKSQTTKKWWVNSKEMDHHTRSEYITAPDMLREDGLEIRGAA